MYPRMHLTLPRPEFSLDQSQVASLKMAGETLSDCEFNSVLIMEQIYKNMNAFTIKKRENGK